MLLFIRVVQAKKAWYNYISIHLMLLFIFLFFQQRYQHLKFQYISCYCLSLYVRSIWQKKLISIHLMLLFIHRSVRTSLAFSISIHLMLLFIQIGDEQTLKALWFQYISCYCLSYHSTSFFLHTLISIHLMLLFIIFVDSHGSMIFDFNTSHVTVYLFHPGYRHLISGISIHLMLLFIWCKYQNLSTSSLISIHLMLLFIMQLLFGYPMSYNFNTSHVTVYLNFSAIASITFTDFNTSHVTVYLWQKTMPVIYVLFQYISCYCLSWSWKLYSFFNNIFQYISCYCLSVQYVSYLVEQDISIHLMLLFIG